MKKYGPADLMCLLVSVYIAEKMKSATDEEKQKIEGKCKAEIMKKYPSARDLEVGR